MKTIKSFCLNAFLIALTSNTAMAAVSSQEAERLGEDLTPLGAERAGNAEGAIPAWTGGLDASAGTISQAGFLSDPFPEEQPLFVITADNVDTHKDKLSAGQLAMFKRYPDSYRIPVYKTHRSAAVPESINKLAAKSAVNTTLVDEGNGLSNFSDTRYYPFPIPETGIEVMWNHITRYRGGNLKRSMIQAMPQTNGSFTPIKFEDEAAFPADMSGFSDGQGDNILLVYKQIITSPSRLAGNVLLTHETLNQVKEPRLAWVYSAGQRRVRRAPQVAYDSPGNASDGLRTVDNFDMYSGAPDRYDWKLVGKKEMYIPYNSYRLASPDVSYKDIHQAGHIDQDLARYELHRVWVVEATVKSGERHVYAKRTLYIDEDSWMVAEAEHYDGRGQMWRVGEGHIMQHYGQDVPSYAAETLYDLISGRYITVGLSNEEKFNVKFGVEANIRDFTAAALRAQGIR